MKTDILIVGGGLAGLNAASEIHETAPGLCVTVADIGGGASSEIMGFSAPANPPDSPDILYQDTIRSGAGFSDPEIVRILADHALPEMHRLEKMGLVFDKNEDGSYNMVPALGTTYPRVVHHGTTTGQEAIRLLRHPVIHRRAARLALNQGRIAGAFFENGEFCAAKAVILAGGGFAGLWKFSSWTKSLRGCSLILAMDAGAEFTGIQFVQFEPTIGVWPEMVAGFPVITTLLKEGGRLIDKDGKNLLDGPVPRKRELAALIQKAIDEGRALSHGGIGYDLRGIDEPFFQKKYPEYAKKFGPIKELILEVRPGAHTTSGGIKVNPNCETKVPGLFAAGEVMGGIHGRDRLGGNAGLEVFVFGRIAGHAAAEYAENHDFFTPETPFDDLTNDILPEIPDILDQYFTVNSTVERGKEGLQKLLSLPQKPIVRFLIHVFRSFCLDGDAETMGNTISYHHFQ